jgi:hypothetical protein
MGAIVRGYYRGTRDSYLEARRMKRIALRKGMRDAAPENLKVGEPAERNQWESASVFFPMSPVI